MYFSVIIRDMFDLQLHTSGGGLPIHQALTEDGSIVHLQFSADGTAHFVQKLEADVTQLQQITTVSTHRWLGILEN